MWAKVLTNVILQLVTSLASWAWNKTTGYFARKKRVEKTEEVAKEIQNAKTQQDIRNSVDDLP